MESKALPARGRCDLGLDAGIHDLSVLGSLTSPSASIALDINESTQIAGGRGADIASEEAIVWTIASGVVTGTLLDFSSSVFEDIANNRAHG